MSRSDLTGVVIDTTFGQFPLVASPEQMASVYGKTGRAVRDDCESGVIPTLTRAAGSGTWHRIPVAKALDAVGVPYQILPAAS
jgi:hypothetical protein